MNSFKGGLMMDRIGLRENSHIVMRWGVTTLSILTTILTVTISELDSPSRYIKTSLMAKYHKFITLTHQNYHNAS